MLQDRRLSWEQRGMLADLLSRPVDFEVNVAGLMKLGGRGRDKVHSLLKEPIALGYIEKCEERSADGKFARTVYRVYSLPRDMRERVYAALDALENPDTDEPHTENPDMAKPHTEKPDTAKPDTAKGRSYTESFNDFWSAYPSKRGKAMAARKWSRMSEDQRQAAKAAIPAYIADCKKHDRPFQHGSTYLNS